MRNSELKTGIEVFDEKGEVVGTSKVAAKKVRAREDVYRDAWHSCMACGEVWNGRVYMSFE